MAWLMVLGLLLAFHTNDRHGQGALQAQSRECASIRSPEQAAYAQAIRDSVLNQTSMRGTSGSFALAPVDLPVQWHVVRSAAGLGGLSDAEAALLLDTLNHFFRPAGIRFYACGPVHAIHSDAHFRLNTGSESALCDPNDRIGAINIYVVDEVLLGGMPICGYAYFPGGLDRVILDADCARNGNTIVHEMGHYLGLDHTHGPGLGSSLELVNGSNCMVAGDGFCDTPADPGLNYFTVSSGCVYGGTVLDANGQVYQPATDNFMSYARLSCRRRFSPEQLKHMAYSATYERNHLSCPCAPPSALEARIRQQNALLRWTDAPDHDVFRLTGEAMEGPLAGQAGSMVARKPSVNMPPLRPYTHYRWTVQARCTDGSFSLASWPDTFKTEGTASSQKSTLLDLDQPVPLPDRAAALGLMDWGPVPLDGPLWMRWHRKEAAWLTLTWYTADGNALEKGNLYVSEGLQRVSWPPPAGASGPMLLHLAVDGQRLTIPVLGSR
jgi:hypothetical protein